MIYKGEFADVNGVVYTVRVTTDGSGTTNLTLGVPPFVTEMEDGEDTIYKPVKYQSGTLKVITGDYLFDIYSSTAQGSKVELLKNGATEWVGYVTPNLYDMGFNEQREEVEIECIDALSTLQYYKYQPIGVTSKNIKTLKEILVSVLRKCNAYRYLYVSNNLQLTQNGNVSVIEKFTISESNFFNEKDDEKKTDNDVAWTCQEVLEEICRYLGYTCVADGNRVYLMDYDAIRNGINTYYRYDLLASGSGTLVTMEHSKLIQASDYSENGATLSLDNVYNKATVTDDLYTYVNVIPDMFENLTNITKSSDASLSNSTNINQGMYGEVVQSTVDNAGDKVNNNMIVMIDRTYNPQSGNYKDYNAVFVKYFTNPDYRFYQYNGNARTEVGSLNYTDTKNFHGAFIGKFDVEKLESGFNEIQQWVIEIAGGQLTIDDWLAKNQISQVNFTNYICLINSESNHIGNDNITNYPYIETKPNINTTALFGGDNAYLVISGSCNFHYFTDDPYPIPENESDISEGRYYLDEGEGYLLARLMWGSLYWNGSEWTSTPATFKIPYVRDDVGTEKRRADALMFKDNSFINSVSWRIGTKEKGYLIPMPSQSVISGLPIFTLYKPYNPTYHSHGQYYKMNCVFLKDFQIKAIIGDPTYSGANDTDTTYTNIINDQFVNELDEVKYKICTWDNKNPNYSCVAYADSSGFVNGVWNKALSGEFTDVVQYDGNQSNGSLRMEEQFIYKVTKQYSTPSVKLNLKLRNNNKAYGLYTDTTISDRYFIVDSISTDYKMNSQQVTLVEKK